jgi:hypothetical protein
MDEALVEDPEHHVDHQDGEEQQRPPEHHGLGRKVAAL